MDLPIHSSNLLYAAHVWHDVTPIIVACITIIPAILSPIMLVYLRKGNKNILEIDNNESLIQLVESTSESVLNLNHIILELRQDVNDHINTAHPMLLEKILENKERLLNLQSIIEEHIRETRSARKPR
jgi:hypothetical protein